MFKLYSLGNNQYRIEREIFNSVSVIEGTFLEVVAKFIILHSEFYMNAHRTSKSTLINEFEFAATEMLKHDHNAADFGRRGTMIFTYKEAA